MLNYKIRPAEPKDIDQVIRLCQAHAAYERSDYFSKEQEKRLPKALFGSKPDAYCLVVEVDNDLVGYATYMVQYATWDAQHYLYMDCLYLEEHARGLGIGRELMKTLMDEAERLNCRQIQWQTPVFNAKAIAFYVKLGAAFKTKERFFLEL